MTDPRGSRVRRARTALAVLALAAAVAVPATAAALPGNPSSAFEPSDGCGCHAALLEQWRPSMHRKALTDPLYLYKLDKALKATDGALSDYCNGCHSPIAVMSGEITGLDQSKLSPSSADAVTCDFCHQVTGTRTPIGNTSQEVAADGVKRAQLKDAMSPSHATAYSAFHETGEFCGSCHDVIHPLIPGFLLESTYTEWKNGPYAAEGIVCQDCHMTPGPGVVKPNPGKAAGMGPEREHIYLMTFAGGNVGLGDAVLAEERLKAAVTIDLAVEEIVSAGTAATLAATVTNVGAGHYVPTGLTDFRECWLEVVATGEDGTELMRERRDFVTVFKDAEGNFPAEIWEAVAVESDDRIPPRGAVTSEYDLTMTEGPVTVIATMYYRSATEETAKAAGVELPTTTMAHVTKTVYSSADQKAAAPQPGETTGGGSGLLIAVVALVVLGGAGAVFLATRRKAA